MKKTTTVILTAVAGTVGLGTMIMTRRINKQSKQIKALMSEIDNNNTEDEKEKDGEEAEELNKEETIEKVDDSDIEV